MTGRASARPGAVPADAVQVASYMRTTLPLDLSGLAAADSGRYHSLWLSDHLVSLWPDSLWTPEHTDLATVSPSPHRHLDGLAVAAAVAARTERVPIVTSVVDTVRRHPAMLAQTALTLDHLSCGRFVLGLGAGETENCVPYGFDFSTPVSRFEEALHVIEALWHTDGPVDFEGRFYRLHGARLDTELYGGTAPPIWIGGSGPRMLGLAGRHADGWWPIGGFTAETYADMLGRLRRAAEEAGRDPMAITPAGFVLCLLGDDEEVAEMVRAPLVQAYLLQVPASFLRLHGFAHPMGDAWRGIHDLDPRLLTRERLLEFLGRVDPRALLAVLPHGSPWQVAGVVKGYVEAGLRVPRILDYGGMAGLRFGAASARKVTETEDALMELVGGAA